MLNVQIRNRARVTEVLKSLLHISINYFMVQYLKIIDYYLLAIKTAEMYYMIMCGHLVCMYKNIDVWIRIIHTYICYMYYIGRKKVAKNWEEDDFYSSDEDTFLDRTGISMYV